MQNAKCKHSLVADNGVKHAAAFTAQVSASYSLTFAF
jgi:hypothetical protein